jgi:replicative DNA helicase Mcm
MTDQTTTDKFLEFYRRYYSDEIGRLAQTFGDEDTPRSLFIEYSDLFSYNRELAENWLDNPEDMKEYAEDALNRYDLPADVDLSDAHVRLNDTQDTLETKSVPEVRSKDIGDYMAVRGKLSRVTEVKHRMSQAAFECQRCGAMTFIDQPRLSTKEPTECASCTREGPFEFRPSDSVWVDQRKLKVEELPGERPEANPESITVFADDDLCHYGGENGLPDRTGQDVVVLGPYNVNEQELKGRNADNEAGGWIDAHSIAFMASSHDDVDVEEHKDAFTAASNRDEPIEFLKDQIVPGMHRDDDLDNVFEAVVAWLFNAYRVEPESGAGRFRGDLHLGIISPPGRGKSTLGSALNKIAPKSEFRSGTGLSKVGLTAATVEESFAGKTEWSLSPGILPRCDGGHCIIDEVDDVVDENTKAIHDALEGDQMVKVDKADVSADLPTRTALLAMGNPEDGYFDKNTENIHQIGMDDALVDRLDLLFMLDSDLDLETHEHVADHIIESFDELSQQQAYEEGADVDPVDPDTTDRELSIEAFRAMVVYARDNVFPTLTDVAKRRLKEFYVDVQDLNDGADDPDPATPRRLEAGIRLSVAFARAELSETVEKRHAERAIKLSKKVVGNNYDPETGKFDAARTGKGTPKSQKERRKRIKNVIDDYAGDNPADWEAVKEELVEQHGMDAGVAEDEKDNLYDAGELYSPTNDEHYYAT